MFSSLVVTGTQRDSILVVTPFTFVSWFERRLFTAPESKHLTPKNEISDFFGSGIDSHISRIVGDPPGGLLIGTKLVSQNLAGF